MQEYTTKNDWDKYLKRYEPKLIESVVFADVFKKYLTPDKNKSILEIGCAGGNFLCYLVKTFGYRPYGIDYSDEIMRTKELFEFNGLKAPVLYKGDFFQWNPNKKFDVVCSFGFVEHFKNIDHVIKRHADLVAPGGKLIITLPHFAHAQYFFHWLIDRENLKKHNTKIMNLNSIRKAVKNSGLRIEHLSYYETFGFWTENNNITRREKIIKNLIRFFGKVLNKTVGYDRPNFLFSPFIVCVATH